MNKLLLLSMTFLVILTGCNGIGDKKDSETKEQVDKSATPIKAEIQLSNQAKTGEKTKIVVEVSQNDQPVNASEVVFEIVKTGENTKQMIDTKNTKQGNYEAEYIFQTAGTYRITAHVTASNMHTMPEDEITVVQAGNVSSSKKNTTSEHHHSHVEFEFNPKAVQSIGKQELLVSIKNEHHPLEKSEVQFEVWLEGTDKHLYIPANEIKPGSYMAEITFSETGIHNIQIHVVKDEIHDHSKYQVNIQN
ncbi:FixH family protein [Peribacillus alkalitolerans]|uniref:FixH family protein n=1 Tax=Peribacillus alkalitolerans TaxID=1550385 RepID=UPI0013D3F7C8|nr:FixH family protein [Peribacillus alkalitolerans]